MVHGPMDRYVVLEYLAEGGMGAIYKGKKLGAGGFEKEVVLKQLLPEYTQQAEFIDLFLREARLTATLDHANIVHTIDLVRAGDEYFMVMEYVRGGDLRTLLKRAKRRKKRVHAAAALFLARELLSALAYAHQKLGLDGRPLGLIHRDVSPSNILVSGAGEVKLTDFGIAKATTHHSVFYRVKGKVGYMSPEQARNQELDPRSDLYSVAVVLYEMLTGERLLVSAGLTVTPEQVYAQPVPVVSTKNDALPRELDAIMVQALAVDPAKRFQTAGEMREALLRIAHRHGLMWGAPDLGKHLLEICGPVAEWGSAAVQAPPPREERRGTEVTFNEGPATQRIPAIQQQHHHPAPELDADDVLSDIVDDDERSASLKENIDDLLWVDELARGAPRNPTGPQKLLRHRAETGMHRVSDFAGLELTSMFSDFGSSTQVGANPLVDLSTPPAPPPVETEKIERLERLERLEAELEPSVVEEPPMPPVPALPPRRSGRFLLYSATFLVAAGIAMAIGFTGAAPRAESPRVPPAPPAPAVGAASGWALEVTSEPNKARVVIGGNVRCTTPCTLSGLASTSPVILHIEKDGYFPWSALVAPGQTTRQGAKLRRIGAATQGWGTVQVHTRAPQAILVNGESVGHLTTSGPLALPPGDTLLTLVGSGGTTTEVKVQVKPREITTVDLTAQ
jgi:serine/threonine protein kinase